jgi:hypothetical protein
MHCCGASHPVKAIALPPWLLGRDYLRRQSFTVGGHNILWGYGRGTFDAVL